VRLPWLLLLPLSWLLRWLVLLLLLAADVLSLCLTAIGSGHAGLELELGWMSLRLCKTSLGLTEVRLEGWALRMPSW